MPIKKNADIFDRLIAGELPQADLASALGLAIPTISRFLTGASVATPAFIDKVARFTGRPKVDVVRALNSRVNARTKQLEEAYS